MRLCCTRQWLRVACSLHVGAVQGRGQALWPNPASCAARRLQALTRRNAMLCLQDTIVAAGYVLHIGPQPGSEIKVGDAVTTK